MALCITSACDNPEGVFKYFLETALDGGEVQELWTYGVEGVHWSTAAEEVCGVQYEKVSSICWKAARRREPSIPRHFLPETILSPGSKRERIRGAGSFDPMILESNELFNANSRPAQLPVSTDEMAQYNGDLTTLKYSIIADCITQEFPWKRE